MQSYSKKIKEGENMKIILCKSTEERLNKEVVLSIKSVKKIN